MAVEGGSNNVINISMLRKSPGGWSVERMLDEGAKEAREARTEKALLVLLPDAGEEASFNWKQSGMTGVELLGVLELMKAEVMKAMGVV